MQKHIIEEGILEIHHDEEGVTNYEIEDGIKYLIDKLIEDHQETLDKKRAALNRTTKAFGDNSAISIMKDMDEQLHAIHILEEAKEAIEYRF